MAEFIIKPNNIYSKPRYSLLKNNIIKNPSINYNYLEYDNIITNNYDDYFELVGTEENDFYLETPYSNYVEEIYFYLQNNFDSWQIYDFQEIKKITPTGDDTIDETGTFASYVILRKVITPNGIADFNNENIKVNLSGKVQRLWRDEVNTDYTFYTNVEFFEKDFDQDNLTFTFDNASEYFYSTGGTDEVMKSAYKVITRGYQIELYCILGCHYSVADFNGIYGEATTINPTPSYDRFFADYTILSTIEYKNYIKKTKDLIKNESVGSDYTLTSNEIINEEIANAILNDIYNKYNKGRVSIDLTVFANKFYNDAETVIYNGAEGELIQVGDVVAVHEYKRGELVVIGGKDKKFEVTSVEFEYRGQPLQHLKLLEKK